MADKKNKPGIDVRDPFGMTTAAELEREGFDHRRDVLIKALNSVANTAQGRTVIWHMLTLTEMHNSGQVGSELAMYLRGKQTVGLDLVALMSEAEPTMYARILLEVAKADTVKRDREAAKTANHN